MNKEIICPWCHTGKPSREEPNESPFGLSGFGLIASAVCRHRHCKKLPNWNPDSEVAECSGIATACRLPIQLFQDFEEPDCYLGHYQQRCN